MEDCWKGWEISKEGKDKRDKGKGNERIWYDEGDDKCRKFGDQEKESVKEYLKTEKIYDWRGEKIIRQNKCGKNIQMSEEKMD